MPHKGCAGPRASFGTTLRGGGCDGGRGTPANGGGYNGWLGPGRIGGGGGLNLKTAGGGGAKTKKDGGGVGGKSNVAGASTEVVGCGRLTEVAGSGSSTEVAGVVGGWRAALGRVEAINGVDPELAATTAFDGASAR